MEYIAVMVSVCRFNYEDCLYQCVVQFVDLLVLSGCVREEFLCGFLLIF